MQTIKLTEAQVFTLKSMHRSTKNRKKADRIKTILFLHRWFSMKETAELLLLDEKTVGTIRDRFISDGIDEFTKDSYVLYTGKLTQEQKEQVRTFVRNNLVLDTIIVIEFVKEKFGILSFYKLLLPHISFCSSVRHQLFRIDVHIHSVMQRPAERRT